MRATKADGTPDLTFLVEPQKDYASHVGGKSYRLSCKHETRHFRCAFSLSLLAFVLLRRLGLMLDAATIARTR